MKIGRNDPCSCGSGKKYKKCCLEQDQLIHQETSGAGQSIESLAKGMGSRDTAEGSLRHKIVEFANEMDVGNKYFLEAKEKWDKEKIIDPSTEAGQAAFLDMMDYFIHDFLIPNKGKPVLNLFYDDHHYSLPPAELSILEEWQDNRKGFYEVQKVRPGEGVDVCDLLTRIEYRVFDKNSSRFFQPWDLFYGRLLQCEGRWTLTGTAQPIQRRLKNEVVAYIKENLRSLQTKEPSLTLEHYLKRSAPEMREFIERVHDENSPEFRTSTGELLTPTEATFEISDPVAVEERLRHMDDFGFVGESDEKSGGKRYDWLQRGASAHIETGKSSLFKRGVRAFNFLILGLSFDNAPVLGNLTITASELRLSCLSQERMDQLMALLEKRLGRLIYFKAHKRIPLKSGDKGAVKSKETGAIPAEAKGKLITKFLEDYYREWKDKPLPSLSGMTPHQAAKDPVGLKALEELLKDVENIEAHQKRRGEIVYGADRLRAELGLTEREKAPPSHQRFSFEPGSYGDEGQFVPSIGCLKQMSPSQWDYDYVLVKPKSFYQQHDKAAKDAEQDLEKAFEIKQKTGLDTSVGEYLAKSGYLRVEDFKMAKER